MTDKVKVEMRTFTGRWIDLLNFKKEDIDLRDIAVSLSRQSRYAGHSALDWSVGQHIILCGAMGQAAGVSDDDVKALVLHDVEETWVQDVIWPIKNNFTLSKYGKVSDKISDVVYDFFGLKEHWSSSDTKYLVKTFDRAAYIIEGFQLLPGFVHEQEYFNDDINNLVKKLIEEDFSIPDWLLHMPPNDVANEIFEILNVWNTEHVLGIELSSEKENENVV